FLGTRLRIGRSRTGGTKVGMVKRIGCRPYRKRNSGFAPVLKAPINLLIDKLHAKGYCRKDGNPPSKEGRVERDTEHLITLSNRTLWGLLNYYRFAHNFSRMSRIQYVLRFSLAKTLTHKYKTTMRRVFRKHGKNLRFQWTLPDGQTREVPFRENTDWSKDTKA